MTIGKWAGATTLLLAISTVWIGCSKTEMAEPVGAAISDDPQSVGTPKALGVFFSTWNGAMTDPNVTVKVYNHCHQVVATHKTNAIGNRVFNTTACSNPNFGADVVGGGTFCYQTGTWYWLKAPSGPFLKFKLGPLFWDAGSYGPLFKFDASLPNPTWTCPSQPVSDPDVLQWQLSVAGPPRC